VGHIIFLDIKFAIWYGSSLQRTTGPQKELNLFVEEVLAFRDPLEIPFTGKIRAWVKAKALLPDQTHCLSYR
jgi:hypothetical protein